MGKGQIKKKTIISKPISKVEVKGKKIAQKCLKNKTAKFKKQKQLSTQPSSCKEEQNLCIKDIMQYYHQQESLTVLQKYNKEILELYKETENKRSLLDYDALSIPTNLFDRRAFLEKIDLEIQRFQGANETFFMISYLIDAYLSSATDIKSFTKKDYDLMGLTAFYIASKNEDLYPLRMYDVQTTIANNQFTIQEIKDKEIEFLNVIGWDLITITSYEEIQTFFCDCAVGIKEEALKETINENIHLVIFSSLQFAKYGEMETCLIKVKTTYKALACIVLGFEFISSQKNTLTPEAISYLKGWITMLLDVNKAPKDVVASVHDTILAFYTNSMTRK